jgi:hypothetical protein
MISMRKTLFAATALALCAGYAPAGQGQGTVKGEPKIDGLNLGTYWYGTQIDKSDLKGKVVLVEIWGS